MRKILGNLAWVSGAYILLCIFHAMGVSYELHFYLNPSIERKQSVFIDFMTAPVGCGFLLAILLGVVIAVLRNVNFMHLHNFAGADERFREGWRGFLKKLLLVFGATVCLFIVFDVYSGRLYVAVAEIIMRLTGMDALDRIASAQGNIDILFATMDISCGFAGAIVPNLFTLAEMFLIYLVYQVVCLLFVSKVNEPALI